MKSAIDTWASSTRARATVLRDQNQQEVLAKMKSLQADIGRLKAGHQSVRDRMNEADGTRILARKRKVDCQSFFLIRFERMT